MASVADKFRQTHMHTDINTDIMVKSVCKNTKKHRHSLNLVKKKRYLCGNDVNSSVIKFYSCSLSHVYLLQLSTTQTSTETHINKCTTTGIPGKDSTCLCFKSHPQYYLHLRTKNPTYISNFNNYVSSRKYHLPGRFKN